MRLERPLWVRQETTGGKGAKGANCLHNPAHRIRQRYQSCRRTLRPPVCAARRGGNWRKLPAKTSLEKLSAVSLSHSRGPLRCKTTTALPEIPPKAIAYGAPRRLDRSAPRIPRGKLRAERRELFSTISGLLQREGPSARPFGPWSGRREVVRVCHMR